MKTAFAAALLAATCVLPAAAIAAQPRAAQAQPVRYNARQFFETTSYGMASPTGIAFSRDGRNLLIHSDRSGVFNVYALPIAGGNPAQISQSTTNATFAPTYSPNDDRALYSAQQGGNELGHGYARQA